MRHSIQIKIQNPVVRLFLLVIFVPLWIGVFLSVSHYKIGTNLITGEWITYVSSEYCYSFQYPGRWRSYSSGNSGLHDNIFQRTLLITPTPYFFGGGHFTIEQKPWLQPELEEVAEWSRRELHKQANIPELESTEVDTKMALKAIYESDNNKSTEIYIARAFDGLVLRLTTREMYHNDVQDTLQEIINTLSYESDCKSFTQ